MQLDDHSIDEGFDHSLSSDWMNLFRAGLTDGLRLKVAGESMMPLLRPRDAVIVSQVKPNQLICGDIIVRYATDFVTHRYIRTVRGMIYTKGDGRYYLDAPFDPGEIVGRVTIVERSGKQINFNTKRWVLINRLIGCTSSFPTRSEAGSLKQDTWVVTLAHRALFWLNKRLIWIILMVCAYKWMRQD